MLLVNMLLVNMDFLTAVVSVCCISWRMNIYQIIKNTRIQKVVKFSYGELMFQ
jgi:hypothetical protein